MSSVTLPGAIHLGMDTSKDTIVVAVLMPGEELPAVDRVAGREEAVRRLIGRFGDQGGCGPAMRRGRVAMTCTGCWPRWGWRVTWSPRR